MPLQDITDVLSKLSTISGSKRDLVLVKQFSPDKKRGQIEYLFDVDNWSPYFKSMPRKKYRTMLTMLQLPFTKGSIHIPPRSSLGPSRIDNKPIINPQYYTRQGGDIDFTIMVAVVLLSNRTLINGCLV
jgi:hypothetical protein